MLSASVITLFPDWVHSVAEVGVVGRACRRGLASLEVINPRRFAQDRHLSVDDRPYGGGPGMVMLPGPMIAAIRAQRQAHPGAHVVLASPQGAPLKQAKVREWHAMQRHLVFIAGRYEGLDERIIELEVDEEASLGDFVLSGGELACMAFFDALVRLQPGALGHAQSAQQDSFDTDLLDYPHYTRPESFEQHVVPKVLTQGNHREIARWRHQQALTRTAQRRPDLLAQRKDEPER